MDGAEIRTIQSMSLGARGDVDLQGGDEVTSGPYRGVFATRDLPAGWEAARVPISMFVNIEHVLADKVLGAEIRRAETRLGYEVYEPAALGVFLARSASRRSAERAADLAADGLDYADKFASYAKWLARSDVYGSPALWRGDGEIPEKECVDGGPLRSLPALTDWLEGTSILREAQVWQEALFENWREWGRDAWSRTVDGREQPSPRKSSSEDFCREHRHRRRFMLWAQIVQSRVHTVSVRDRAGKWVKTKCMVPVADAINTGPPSGLNVRCFTNDASTHFVCETLKPVVAGSELLTAYGSGGMSPGRILLQYGFVPPWLVRVPRQLPAGGGRPANAENVFSSDVIWIRVGTNRTEEKFSSNHDVDRLVEKWGVVQILYGVERALAAIQAGEAAFGEGTRNRLRAICAAARAAEQTQLEAARAYIAEKVGPQHGD